MKDTRFHMSQHNWRQVLSWQEIEDLTGWLVKIVHKKSKDVSYGVVLQSYFNNKDIKAIWTDTEEKAIKLWSYSEQQGMYVTVTTFNIIPLRKVKV